MKAWKEITHYAGVDWARDHHAVVIVDAQGQIVADFEFEHSLEGWQRFVEKTAAWPHLAVAIETNQGAAVDRLLQREYTVYPVNPVGLGELSQTQSPQRHQDRPRRWLGVGRRVARRRPGLEAPPTDGSPDPAVASALPGRSGFD